MAKKTYINFDLFFEQVGEGYTVGVLSPSGGLFRTQFILPFSDTELENFFIRIGQSRSITDRDTLSRDQFEIETIKEFGGRLFKSIFKDEVKEFFRDRIKETNCQEEIGLRIRLHLVDVPRFADVPWEYLYNPDLNRFLALSVDTPIVRFLKRTESDKPMKVLNVELPLKALVMISNARGQGYPQLDVNREWQNLKDALRNLEQRGLVTLELLESPTLSALENKLEDDVYHIFHFIGHGGYDEQSQDGVLVMENNDGQNCLVTGENLGIILHDERTLRLVILNTCEGARTSLTDPFAGTAQSLVQQGIPAVIAMQFEITDQAAITLSSTFYESMAKGYPVDYSLARARKAIKNSQQDSNSVEWGVPVLYMRSSDGHIFDIDQIDILKDEAQSVMQKKDWKTATDKWQAVLALDPDNTEAEIGLKRTRWIKYRQRLSIVPLIITFLINAYKVIKDYSSISKNYVSMLIIVLIVVVYAACTYLWRAKQTSSVIRIGKRRSKVIRLPRLWRYALLALTILTIIFTFPSWSSSRDRSGYGIVITEFESRGGAGYPIANRVYRDLEDKLENNENVWIEYIETPITTSQGSEFARRVGEQKGAELVIWGLYDIGPDSVQFYIYCDVIQEDIELLALNDIALHYRVDKNQYDNFSHQDSLALAIECLSNYAYGISLIHIEDYHGAIESFTEALSICDIASEYFYRDEIYRVRALTRAKIFSSELSTRTGAAEFRIQYDPYLDNMRPILDDSLCTMLFEDCHAGLNINPDNVELRILLAKIGIISGHIQDARQQIDSLLLIPDTDLSKVHFLIGLLEVAEGNPDSAIAAFSAAIDIDSMFAMAYLNRISLNIQFGQYQLAESDILTLSYFNIDNISILEKSALLCLSLSDYSESIELCTEIIESCSVNANAFYLRAICYSELGSYSLALTDLDSAIAICPYIQEYYTREANLYISMGYIEEAENILLEAIVNCPASTTAYLTLGNLCANQGRNDEALEFYNTLLEIAPEASIVLFRRSQIYIKQSNHIDALRDLDRVIEISNDINVINIDIIDAYLARAIVNACLGNMNVALHDAKYALALLDYNWFTHSYMYDASPMFIISKILNDCKNFRNQLNSLMEEIRRAQRASLLDSLLEQGREEWSVEGWTDAYSTFTDAINLDSASAEAYSSRGDICRIRGDLKSALSDFNRAIEIDSTSTYAYYSRAIVFNSFTNYELAISDLTTAVSLDTTFSMAYSERGITNLLIGDNACAISDFNTAISINPNIEDVYFHRAIALAQIGESDRALIDFDKAIELDPEDASAFFNRGYLYSDLGKYMDAITDFTRAIELNPGDGHSYYRRAMAYRALGDFAKADADFETAEMLRMVTE